MKHQGKATIFVSAFVATSVAAPSAWSSKPVVAVFQIENHSKLSKGDVEELTSFVATSLASSGRFPIVPSSELKAALNTAKAESYKACYDQSCQIEIGKELAAERTLATKVAKLGSRCIVTMQMYDLRTSASSDAAVERGGCSVDDIVESLEGAVRKITGQPMKATTTQVAKKAEPTKVAPSNKAEVHTSTKEPRTPATVRDIEWVDSSFAKAALTKTEITVGQFEKCVAAGQCKRSTFDTKARWKRCNYGHPDRLDHPMNCVDANGARSFCRFVGGDLPLEKQWHAEATSGGSKTFPWGKKLATCDEAIVGTPRGCGRNTTWPVCSRSKDTTSAGLCDMVGNVLEWVRERKKKKTKRKFYLAGYSFNDGAPPLPATARNERGQANLRVNSAPAPLTGMVSGMAVRRRWRPSTKTDATGFRCARERSTPTQGPSGKWLYREGRKALARGYKDRAKQLFEAAAKKGYSKAYKLLGNIMLQKGQPGKAKRYYKKYLRLRPGASDAEAIKATIIRLGG